jgi:hypothetical protein
MKKHLLPLVFLVSIPLGLIISSFTPSHKNSAGEYYQLTIYHLKNAGQLSVTNAYLKNTLLPALHTFGLSNIGVFSAIENDTATDKKLYVLIPFTNFEKYESLMNAISAGMFIKNDNSGYTDAAFNNAPFERIENVLLKAFRDAPILKTPVLTAPLTERVYELRSYEASTEKLYQQKVNMFNQGGEVDLFNRLQFNAVFYGEVLNGSHMPNLMYMTTFDNKASRDKHWKNFVADTTWKRISALPQYQNTVSKADIFFLRPVEYSDY